MIINRNSLKDYKSTMADVLNCKKKNVTVIFDDDVTIEMKRGHTIHHLVVWRILYKYNMPFLSKYQLPQESVSDKKLAELSQMVYDDQLAMGLSTNIQFDYWYVQEDLRRFIMMHCNKYHISLSRSGLARTMLKDKVKDLVKNLNYDKRTSTRVVEKKLKASRESFVELIKSDEFRDSQLYPLLKFNAVNPKQLQQVLLGVGTRTDIDDNIITYPIRRPFYKGLNTIEEAITEFATAKKSAFFNKAGVPEAALYAKYSQLTTSFFKYGYNHDCGANFYFPWHVLPGTAHNLIGKSIRHEGVEVFVDEDNYKHYDNKYVEFRSIFGCKHKDGVCAGCTGKTFHYYPSNISRGLVSTVKIAQPTVQGILSIKHHQETHTLVYILHEILRDYMYIKNDSIFFLKTAIEQFKKKYKIGVTMSNFSKISDLFLLDNLDTINEDYFSRIRSISILDKRTDEIIAQVKDTTFHKNNPFLSMDTLKYIKANYNKRVSTRGDLITIDFEDFDFKKPILKTPVMNDGILHFVNEVKAFSSSKIREYNNLVSAFKELTRKVYQGADVNIIHLEMLLRSNLITGPYDYRTPIIHEDELENRIHLASNSDIARNKSLATTVMYGRSLIETLVKPEMFLIPRKASQFEKYIGLL